MIQIHCEKKNRIDCQIVSWVAMVIVIEGRGIIFCWRFIIFSNSGELNCDGETKDNSFFNFYGSTMDNIFFECAIHNLDP